MPSIFSLFLCVSCLLFVSVLITCFFFLFTFCKHCMQKKCYDLRSLLYCKLHHTTSFPFISPLPKQPSIFATNRASLQAKENLRKCSWTSATVSMKDLLPHGQLETWWKENYFGKWRLHTPIIWLWGKIPNWWWVVLKKIEVHALNLYFQHVFSSATVSSQ